VASGPGSLRHRNFRWRNWQFCVLRFLLPHVAARMRSTVSPRRLRPRVCAVAATGVDLAWICIPNGSASPADRRHRFREDSCRPRFGFLSVAIWWALFSIPLFATVREPAVKADAAAPRSKAPLKSGLPEVACNVPRVEKLPQRIPDASSRSWCIMTESEPSSGWQPFILQAASAWDKRRCSPAVLLTQFVGVPLPSSSACSPPGMAPGIPFSLPWSFTQD